MAWKKVLLMEERIKFALESDLKLRSFKDLCLDFGISRKTGYKWRKRYKQSGLKGMLERSCAPKTCPHKTSGPIVELLLRIKRRYPGWGPKKIRNISHKKHGVKSPPAASTIGDILKRNGLVKRRKNRSAPVRRWPGTLKEATKPNEVWGVDFKGWFRTEDGKRCDPLTISDLYSRYVIGCNALTGQRHETVRPVFEKVFRGYGLPENIRVDNGSPFGSTGPWGFTQLSLWWFQLGITVEFIDPGHPEQNSIHERMHRTLKDEATRPPKKNRREQQKHFNEWKEMFNQDRPHEGIQMSCPVELYQRSEKEYKGRIQPFQYPSHYGVRKVSTIGQIRVGPNFRFIGHSFSGAHVGLEDFTENMYKVYFADLEIGLLAKDSSKGLIHGKKVLPMYPV